MINSAIKTKLDSLSQVDQDYWSFRGKAVREHAHAFFQYPAMMVPQMQGQLIDSILENDASVKHVFDPFVGSGTVLTETMTRGLDFYGQDINPLAILLCRAKMGPFQDEFLSGRIRAVIERIDKDCGSDIAVSFPNIDKWFKREVSIDLSKIHRSILLEKSILVRRFLWVALAATARLTSNTRTSTFKLHIRDSVDIATRELAPLSTFKDILDKNFRSFVQLKQCLQSNSMLETDGSYKGNIKVSLKDSSTFLEEDPSDAHFDLLVTSPPYGDNTTTVPYGQHSFLPLQWIDLEDIDENIDRSCLLTTHEIDSKSLGGSKANVFNDIEMLATISPSFMKVVDRLKDHPPDRTKRVSAFCRDLNNCLDPILARLRAGAFMIWTVGNRCVAGGLVPTDDILAEFLIARESVLVANYTRKIPSKRMAVKNNTSKTMSTESILIIKKATNG